MSNTITIKDPNGNIVCSVESVSDKCIESLDLTKLKYETGHDQYGSNVSKDTIDFIAKNKLKIRDMILKSVLDYYKTSDYGQSASEEIGKNINDCDVNDMDKMMYSPFKVLEDSSIKKYKKCDFVITAENKLDPEHGVAVGFTKKPLKVVKVSDIGSFI